MTIQATRKEWIIASLASLAPIYAGVFSFAIYLNATRGTTLPVGAGVDWSVAPAAVAYAIVCTAAGGAVLISFVEKMENGATMFFRQSVLLSSVVLIGLFNVFYLIAVR